jgi:hypothetical protein
MDDLRVRARANGVVIGFIGVECERVVKGNVRPITRIAVPPCCYVPVSVIPYLYVFGMPAGAEIGFLT